MPSAMGDPSSWLIMILRFSRSCSMAKIAPLGSMLIEVPPRLTIRLSARSSLRDVTKMLLDECAIDLPMIENSFTNVSMANASSMAASVDTSSTRSQTATTPNSAESRFLVGVFAAHTVVAVKTHSRKRLGLLWRGSPTRLVVSLCTAMEPPHRLDASSSRSPIPKRIARNFRRSHHNLLRHPMRLNSSLTITAFRVCCGQSVRCFSLCGAAGRCRFVRDDRPRASTDCAEPQPAGQEGQLPRRPGRPRTTSPADFFCGRVATLRQILWFLVPAAARATTLERMVGWLPPARLARTLAGFNHPSLCYAERSSAPAPPRFLASAQSPSSALARTARASTRLGITSGREPGQTCGPCSRPCDSYRSGRSNWT